MIWLTHNELDLSKKDSENLGFFASVAGHVGDGNFHEALMYDPTNEQHLTALQKCVHKMMRRAVDMEGTVSGEHAIGMGKKVCVENSSELSNFQRAKMLTTVMILQDDMVHELGHETVLVMKQLKQALDPK